MDFGSQKPKNCTVEKEGMNGSLLQKNVASINYVF